MTPCSWRAIALALWFAATAANEPILEGDGTLSRAGSGVCDPATRICSSDPRLPAEPDGGGDDEDDEYDDFLGDPRERPGLEATVFVNGAHTGGSKVALTREQCDGAAPLASLLAPHVRDEHGDAAPGYCEGAELGAEAACHVVSGFGEVVESCEAVRESARTAPLYKQPLLSRWDFERVRREHGAELYLVPPGRRFVWPAPAPGARRYAPHLGVTLEVLATQPRLFRAVGLLRDGEADELIADALALQDDESRLMRSSTGAMGYTASSIRTSDNAWVQHTPAAMRIKRRAFELLAFEECVKESAAADDRTGF